ncbi:MAG: chemotaxis protein CheD [Desulfuromonadales bacterium]|nr:MAG: chemotaxis protein CheD [Desulfuromonadales bacterium]
MTALHPDIPRVYLKPGEIHFATSPTVVTTVLGSCVSVTMFSRATGSAAICHALLPEGPRSDAFRYVDTSIVHMLEMFSFSGIPRRSLEVKVFGGADMMAVGGSRLGVGRRNVQIAAQVLEAEGLDVTVSDVGGTRGRKLLFHTGTGEVLLRRLRGGEDTVVQQWPR